MPRMTGLAVAAQIKKISPGTPVILTTGFSSEFHPQALKHAGVDDLLMKPFTMQTLGACLGKALARRR